MADIDINPFGEHNRTESRPDESTGGNIPLTPVGGSTWEPEHEQETSFRGTSHEREVSKEELVKKLYQLIGNKIHQRAEPSSRLFRLGEDGRLYYKGEPLMKRNGNLKKIGVIADMLGIRGL